MKEEKNNWLFLQFFFYYFFIFNIFYENCIKTFIEWSINKCPKGILLIELFYIFLFFYF